MIAKETERRVSRFLSASFGKIEKFKSLAVLPYFLS
jgi:hypothetical protein